jgi:DNA-binding CsgD family transcriptional regulator
MQVMGNARAPDGTSDTVPPSTGGSRGAFAFLGRTFIIAPFGGPEAGGDGSPGELVGCLDIDGCRHLIYRQEPQPESGSRPERLTDLLTRRELEIAMLIADGRCDKEIGRSLGISSYTVREHIRRTCAKLGVSRRAAIVSLVIRSLSGAASTVPGCDIPGDGRRRPGDAAAWTAVSS